MRRVSSKRKAGRRSSRVGGDQQAESTSKENPNDNGEVSIDNHAETDTEETYEPDKKKSNKKSKSVSFTAKESEGADPQYEVEAVLGEKTIKRVKHYLIRWKGYGADSDTWEPEDTLNCNELIKEFHANTPSTSSNVTKEKESNKNGKKRPTKRHSSPVTWSENEEFEVERILEVHHKRDGTREFLVSWKGYPATENSWEPEDNMTCGDLIKKFMAKVEKAKETDLRELREKRTPTNRFTLNDATKGRRLSKRNSGRQRVQYHDSE